MKITSLFFCLVFATTLFSQNQIQFANPSFEDTPQAGKVPKGWKNCGHQTESPPDTQPNGMFKVKKAPNDGNSYLGMVVRDNETWEAIGQRLVNPILTDSTYSFTIDLARSAYYVSLSRTTNEEVNYTKPCVLRIWGGNEYGDKDELLFKTGPIENIDWETHNITFTPSLNYEFITFEAYYDTPTLFAYNGNLLLDNIITNAPALSVEELTEIKEQPSELQKDLAAMEAMQGFFNYAKEENVFKYFDHYTTMEIESLAKKFRKFDMNDSANKIEKLVAEWKIAFQSADSTEESIMKFQDNCANIDDILIADKFDEKIDAFIEKNKEGLQLLIKD